MERMNRGRHFSRRELALIFLFWTTLATVSTVNRLIDPRGGSGLRVMSPAGPIALAYIEAWIWAAVTPFVFWLSSRFSVRRFLILLGTGIVIAVLVYVLIE